MADGKRPTVATVFGVLNVIFGGLGVLGVMGAIASLSVAPILGAIQLGNVAGSAVVLFSGILLLTNKKNALSVTNLAILISIGLTLALVVYLIATLGIVGVIASIFAVILGGVYPLLVFLLVLRNETVKSFYNSQS